MIIYSTHPYLYLWRACGVNTSLCFCRLEDLYAIDIRFLHGCEIPTIAYLVEVWLGCPHELEIVLVTNIAVHDDVMVQLFPWINLSAMHVCSLLPVSYRGGVKPCFWKLRLFCWSISVCLYCIGIPLRSCIIWHHQGVVTACDWLLTKHANLYLSVP